STPISSGASLTMSSGVVGIFRLLLLRGRVAKGRLELLRQCDDHHFLKVLVPDIGVVGMDYACEDRGRVVPQKDVVALVCLDPKAHSVWTPDRQGVRPGLQRKGNQTVVWLCVLVEPRQVRVPHWVPWCLLVVIGRGTLQHFEGHIVARPLRLGPYQQGIAGLGPGVEVYPRPQTH